MRKKKEKPGKLLIYNSPEYPLSFSVQTWKYALGMWLSFGFLPLWLPGALFASVLLGGKSVGPYKVGDNKKVED